MDIIVLSTLNEHTVFCPIALDSDRLIISRVSGVLHMVYQRSLITSMLLRSLGCEFGRCSNGSG